VKKKSELNYGALVVDKFDAGQVVYESTAQKMFAVRDEDFALEFVHVDWEAEERETGVDYPWCDEMNQERGRFWSIVYRYYPRRELNQQEPW
tara:strand:- start:153 stop:428 length:276 start_codon:yes stop_codon:yes gene_type:complete